MAKFYESEMALQNRMSLILGLLWLALNLAQIILCLITKYS
jgi:hypothetical protein